jgi:hypothetical protein
MGVRPQPRTATSKIAMSRIKDRDFPNITPTADRMSEAWADPS